MVNTTPSPHPVMPSRIDYKYKRVAAAVPAHGFTQYDSSASSHEQSALPSPTHHKQTSLSLHQPVLPHPSSTFVSAPTVHTNAASTSSSAPPTTTNTYSRFPAVGPPRPFSSAQSVRPRIVRAEDDDEEEGEGERDDGADSVRDGLSDTSSAFSAFSRSREELDRTREERAVRLADNERRQREEKERLEKVTAVAQKAAQMRLRAASAEKAKRKEEEDELRSVVAQVQAREERQRQEEKARKTKQTDQQRREQEQAERRQGEERKEDEEKQMERAKEASMRREHSNGAAQLSRTVRREAQAASPPPPTSSSLSHSASASLPPPTSAASKRSIRSDLLASSLPSNPSYYPTHIHSLLSTAFLPPLSRLFKHYHQRAPSSSASPAYVDMAGGVRASVLSSGDWLLMMSECGVSGVLLSKDGLKRVYMMAVRTERKRSSSGEMEMKDEESGERKNGLGLGRFLKSLWCVARSVGGNERVDDSDSGKQKADMRVMLALLEYIRHHATPQRLGAQLKLQWPDITMKDAVEMHSRAATTATPTHPIKTVKRREEKKATNIDTPHFSTDSFSPDTTAPSKPLQPQPAISHPLPASTATAAATASDDASERERKERKRLRLKMRVEQYRREQEEKDRAKAEDERRTKAEEEEKEAERRRREERLREEEKRRIAEFKTRRKEEIEEMARAEAERAEREERERKRALELYVRQKEERKRREEAEQRQRLMHFHQQQYTQEEAVEHNTEDSPQQHEQPAVQREDRKRRQWDKQPSQRSEPTSSLASNQSTASTPLSATRIPALSSTALSTYLSSPTSTVTGDIEVDGLSVGGESAELDGVDANEETF